MTQSAFALHEFGRRFAEECRQVETTSRNGDGGSETVTYARLPSRLMVSQMTGNLGILQKKLKEVQGVVRRVQEGGYEYPSPNLSESPRGMKGGGLEVDAEMGEEGDARGGKDQGTGGKKTSVCGGRARVER